MLGFVFFSVPVDPINLMGIAIGYALSSSPASQPTTNTAPPDSPSPIAFHRFTGSVYYSVVKYFEQQQTQSKPALAKV